MVYLTLCSYHVTYAFQSESTLYSCLNVKELLAQNRRKIWSLSDCNWTLVKMTSYCLNPNLVLNSCVAVVLPSISTLVANSLSIKILLGCFYGLPTSEYLCFLWSERYFTVVACNFLRSIPSSICLFPSTAIFHYYLLLLLHQFFIRFSAYINHI